MKSTANPNARPRAAALPEEAAYLDLLRTTEFLSRPFVRILKPEDLSAAQYNVLRILRGSQDGLTCSEIGNRMISRDPDITRLLDRMETEGLVRRVAYPGDKRRQLVEITEEGRVLQRRMWGVYGPAINRFIGEKLTETEAGQLTALLLKLTRSKNDPCR